MAAVLDEAMGISAWIMGYTIVAASIMVEYRKMLPLDTVTTIEANIASENGRKIISKGKIYNETGTVYTESEGLYINIPPEKFGEMIKYQNDFQRS